MHVARSIVALLLTMIAVACGGENGNPVGPSNPSPTPSAASLTGTVATEGGSGISGATVTFLDGPNAGRSATTTSGGGYSFTGLTAGNANLSARAPGHNEDRRGITIAGTTSLNFSLQRGPLWEMRGSGNTVFDKPAYVTRVRITGRFEGTGQNFVIWCGRDLLVNEILGTRWPSTSYDGTHATPNCTEVRVENSTGVQWSMAEVR